VPEQQKEMYKIEKSTSVKKISQTFSLMRDSIILLPKSYTVSMSVVFKVSFPTLAPVPVAGLSIWTSTTSPSMISVSSLFEKKE
jgi:hypothetical protein